MCTYRYITRWKVQSNAPGTVITYQELYVIFIQIIEPSLFPLYSPDSSINSAQAVGLQIAVAAKSVN